jgi:hypothetical protein
MRHYLIKLTQTLLQLKQMNVVIKVYESTMPAVAGIVEFFLWPLPGFQSGAIHYPNEVNMFVFKIVRYFIFLF